jgi:hypothetical protein
MLDTSREVVEAQLHPGEIIGTVFALRGGVRLWFGVLTVGLLQDYGVEPFIQR